MSWKYNESKHCGVDYSSAEEVAVYDTRHQQFRNYEKEVYEFLTELSADDTHALTLIDLGCGTGAFSIHAADHFRKIYAVDISELMLKVAREKAEKKNIRNISFNNGGFLSYHHEFEPVDIVLSRFAFHHLPDFWKQTALLNINGMLKTNGLFYLYDVIFNFDPSRYEESINGWMMSFAEKVSPQFLREFETHIREEYSTYGWILEGMLERAGFTIEKKETPDNVHMMFRCRKTTTMH
jgi:putative AdoMet-dependent methyltransferase